MAHGKTLPQLLFRSVDFVPDAENIPPQLCIQNRQTCIPVSAGRARDAPCHHSTSSQGSSGYV